MPISQRIMHDWSLSHSAIVLLEVANFKVGCIDVSLRLIFECSIEDYLRMGTWTVMPKGVPFSSASYALLTCCIAHVCGVFFNSILIYQALMLVLIHEIAI